MILDTLIDSAEKLSQDNQSERLAHGGSNQYLEKINKIYKAPLHPNRGSDVESTDSDPNQARAKKHNLSQKMKKARSNYENAYTSHIPKPKQEPSKTASKYNKPMGYYRNNNKSSILQRKGSPMNKFTPNSRRSGQNVFDLSSSDNRSTQDHKAKSIRNGGGHKASGHQPK